MKKVVTFNELVNMDKNQFRVFDICLCVGALRLLGITWKKYYRIKRDIKTNDIIITYK